VTPGPPHAATVTRQDGIGDSDAAFIAACGLPTDGLDQVWATFIAADGAGFAGITALERHGPADAPVFLLRSVAVRAERRGSGLGAALVTAALAAADAEAGRPAVVGLLTETAQGYFERLGFTRVDRSALPGESAASAELTGACPATAAAYLRRA
jgi:amino-acid N-acetyltransferase